MSKARVLAIGTVLAFVMVGGVGIASADASVPVFANCTAMHKVYKHGVGRAGAHDKVSGKTKPVTNFTVNTAIYNANKKSDADKDGVACEAH